MNAITLATRFIEAMPIPDPLVRLGIAALCGRTHRKLSGNGAEANRDFARATAALPIAEHVEDANAQHYEVPAAFFNLVLGPQRKYSCCLFKSAADDLATYNRVEYWVEKGTDYPIKAKVYADSGRLLKILYYRGFKERSGAVRPSEAVIIDAVDPTLVTTLDFGELVLQDVPESWFQRENLARLQVK